MPRKKSNTAKNKELEESKEFGLTPKDTNYVNDFAQEMVHMMGSSLMYHPILQSQILKDMNMNPVYRDYESAEKLISNPKHNEKALKQLSQYLYNAVMPIKRLIDYYAKILTWDYVLIPQVDEKDLTTASFMRAENKVYDFLENLDVKKMFTEMMTGAMLEDTKFHYLRESEYGHTFQELPSDYCLITSKNEISYEFAFDMTYFFRQGTRLDQYPPEFTDYYLDMMNYDKSKGSTRTDDVIVETKNGKWFYWRQLDPNKAFTFKFNNLVAGLTPPMLGLFLDAIDIQQSKKLHKIKDTLDTYKLLVGSVPRNKENKSGNKSDDFAITAQTVAKFASLIKGSLPEGLDFKVTPFENIESFNFENTSDKTDITLSSTKNFLNSSGSSQIFSINEKPNASSIKANQILDSGFVAHMYSQGSAMINLILRKHVSSKYKFDIKFMGTIFDIGERQEDASKLASIGVVSMDLIASARGLNARQLQRLLASSNAKGYPDKLKPIQSAFQSSQKDTENGRPKEKIEDLDDTGVSSRDNLDDE